MVCQGAGGGGGLCMKRREAMEQESVGLARGTHAVG